jgi:hypothetical protein
LYLEEEEEEEERNKKEEEKRSKTHKSPLSLYRLPVV